MKLTPCDPMDCSLCGQTHRYEEYFRHCGEMWKSSERPEYDAERDLTSVTLDSDYGIDEG